MAEEEEEEEVVRWPGRHVSSSLSFSPAVTVRSIHHLRTHWRPRREREREREKEGKGERGRENATLVEARPLLSVSQLTVGYAMHGQQR